MAKKKSARKTAKKLTLADILPAIVKVDTIEEYAGGRYQDTHTIINWPQDTEDNCLQLNGSERHAEVETAVDPKSVVRVEGNVIHCTDTDGNEIELHCYVKSPLNIKVPK